MQKRAVLFLMNKTSLLLIFSFITLFSIGTLAMVSYQPDLKQRIKETYTSLLENTEVIDSTEFIDSLPEEIAAPIELQVFKGKLNKDSYEDHLIAAERSGVGIIQNENQLSQLLADQILVKTTFGAGYKVDSLTHSVPYVTQNSKKVLEELGRAYEKLSGEGNFFTVSSATRTEEQQKSLKRRNRNATDGASSHSYGVSFDISYIRFNGVREWNQKEQKNLETVLNHFQQTGKIYVIKERRQSCYHITVR